MRLSNLGLYQTMATVAKKVGGPAKFLGLVGVAGYIVVRGLEAGTKKLHKTRIAGREKKLSFATEKFVFEAITDGKDDCGLEFKVGERYRILERDAEAMLIEKLGDAQNPYFVSEDFLVAISGAPVRAFLQIWNQAGDGDGSLTAEACVAQK
jgi:hypothetical protein